MKKLYIILFVLVLFNYCLSELDPELKVGEVYQLPEPDKESGMPLNEALNKRKTSRDFDPSTKLTPELLSQALWSCYGENRPKGYKTTPSAVAWYPLMVYVFLEEGVFKYDAQTHSVTKILDGDYREYCGSQTAVVTKARANFMFIADFKKKSSMDDDEEHKLRSIYLDTGHSTMALSLFAASNNMKGVVREMVDPEPLLELLQLEKDDYIFTLSFSLGF